MSRYLKKMLSLVESREPITPDKWEMIVDNADLQTLNYLAQEGFSSIKYFTRDDWMDPSYKENIQNKVHSRITQIRNDKWFNKHF